MFPSRSVAIVGASNDRRKFGNKAVRAFVASGWEVLPVNPQAAEVEGLPAYPSVAALPHRPDAVALYVPPAVGTKLLPEIALQAPGEVWVNPGAESPELTAAAEALHLPVRYACAILALGRSPHEFPDA